MIFISSRKNFTDPDLLSELGHSYKEVDLNNNQIIATFDFDQLVRKLNDKRIIILIHGYNNEQDEVNDAYAIVEQKFHQYLHEHYDYIIGYSWPAGDNVYDWWQSKSHANAVGRNFRLLLTELKPRVKHIDVMSHSLGARVVLKALKHYQHKSQTLIRHFYCLAAAIDNESLEPEQEFAQVFLNTEKLYLFHSRNDSVLSTIYRLVEFDTPLGLSGPEDKAYFQSTARNVYTINCKKVIHRHGAYKYEDSIYRFILKTMNKKPLKFITLSAGRRK